MGHGVENLHQDGGLRASRKLKRVPLATVRNGESKRNADLHREKATHHSTCYKRNERSVVGLHSHAAPDWASTQGMEQIGNRDVGGSGTYRHWTVVSAKVPGHETDGTTAQGPASCSKGPARRIFQRGRVRGQVARRRLPRTKINGPRNSGNPAGNGKAPRLADGPSGWRSFRSSPSEANPRHWRREAAKHQAPSSRGSRMSTG